MLFYLGQKNLRSINALTIFGIAYLFFQWQNRAFIHPYNGYFVIVHIDFDIFLGWGSFNRLYIRLICSFLFFFLILRTMSSSIIKDDLTFQKFTILFCKHIINNGIKFQKYKCSGLELRKESISLLLNSAVLLMYIEVQVGVLQHFSVGFVSESLTPQQFSAITRRTTVNHTFSSKAP